MLKPNLSHRVARMGQRAGNQRVWQGLLKSCWPLTGRGRAPGSPLLTGAPGGQAPQPGPSRKHPPAVRGSPSHLPPRTCLQQAVPGLPEPLLRLLSLWTLCQGRKRAPGTTCSAPGVLCGRETRADGGSLGAPASPSIGQSQWLNAWTASLAAPPPGRASSSGERAPPHVLGLPGSWGSPPHLTPISLSTADWLRGQPAPVPVPRASCRWLKVRQLRTSPEGGGNTSSLQSRGVSSTLHEGKGGAADIHY